MDSQQLIDRVLRIIKLQPDAYIEVANDETATPSAFLVAVLGSLLSGIGSSFVYAEVSIGSAITGALLGAPIGLLVVTGIFHLIAKLFGGTGTYMALLRPLGHGYAPSALGLVPFVGALLGGIWVLVCSVIAVREVHRLSTGAAVAVALMPAAVLIILGVVLIALLLAAFSTSTL